MIARGRGFCDLTLASESSPDLRVHPQRRRTANSIHDRQMRRDRDGPVAEQLRQRRYTVHTSASFKRSQDQKIVAKVLVTCACTVFGLRSHSATGEEWRTMRTL